MGILTAAIVAMLIQQSLMTMATLAIPSLWPLIGPDFGLGNAGIGFYSLILYAVGFAAASVASSGILRFGPLRSSQFCLILAAWGVLIGSFGSIWLIPPAAFLLGLGMGPSTPASSQVLARFSTPERAPLVFSIKQTGVPVGGFLAGAVLVPVAEALSWQASLLIAGFVAWSAAIWMQRFRDRFDDERIPTRKIRLGDLGLSFRAATATPALRKLAFSGFAFSGLQIGFMSFFIAYAEADLGLDTITAGQVMGAASAVAIAGRIFWGWLAGGRVRPRVLLVWLSIAMFLSILAVGLATPAWGVWAIGAAAVAFGATGVSWNGVHLAEAARLSPPGQVAVVMGGIISCCFLGLLTLPAVLGFVFFSQGIGGSGFIAIALPALACAVLFALPDRKTG